MGKASKYEKLYRIWFELRDGEALSLKDLMAKTGSSRSSVYRYVEELREMGMPVVRNDKGWYLSYKPAEIQMALSLEESFVVGYGVWSLKDKSEASPVILGRMIEGYANLEKQANLEEAESLSVLKRALQDRTVIELEYFTTTNHQVEQRHLEPQDLFLRDGDWFVQGYDQERQALRAFRVAQIQRLRVSERQASGKIAPNSTPVHHWDADGDQPIAVVLSVNEQTAVWLKNQKLHPSLQVHKLEDGLFEVRFRVNNPMNMLPWLMGLMHVRVEQPATLATALLERAQLLIKGQQATASIS